MIPHSCLHAVCAAPSVQRYGTEIWEPLQKWRSYTLLHGYRVHDHSNQRLNGVCVRQSWESSSVIRSTRQRLIWKNATVIEDNFFCHSHLLCRASARLKLYHKPVKNNSHGQTLSPRVIFNSIYLSFLLFNYLHIIVDKYYGQFAKEMIDIQNIWRIKESHKVALWRCCSECT